MAKPDHFPDHFRENYPDILAFAARRCHDRADAEDVAAETFTIAWKKWAEAPSRPRPWLFGIARNVLLGNMRGENRRLRLASKAAFQPDELGENPATEVANTLDFERAWNQLSFIEQETIALSAWDGLNSHEAATVLGIKRAAYAARLSRARKRLRRLMNEPDDTVIAQIPIATTCF